VPRIVASSQVHVEGIDDAGVGMPDDVVETPPEYVD
jgi:hypothetical protein